MWWNHYPGLPGGASVGPNGTGSKTGSSYWEPVRGQVWKVEGDAGSFGGKRFHVLQVSDDGDEVTGVWRTTEGVYVAEGTYSTTELNTLFILDHSAAWISQTDFSQLQDVRLYRRSECPHCTNSKYGKPGFQALFTGLVPCDQCMP